MLNTSSSLTHDRKARCVQHPDRHEIFIVLPRERIQSRNTWKNNHRHKPDIPRIIFLSMTNSLGKKAFSNGLLEKRIDKRRYSTAFCEDNQRPKH
jgi:hypothetical protein